jgi:hypothetical protein
MSTGATAHPARRRFDRSALVPVTALAALAAAVGRGFWRFSYDDAFITYRYARHWAAGGGLVYNRGEAVLGTTAPGYALLLGALTRATGGRLDPPAWGTLLSLAALVATFVLAGAAAARSAPRPSARELFADTPAGAILGHAPAGAHSGWLLAAAAGGLALVMRWNIEMLGAETLPILALAAAAAYLACERDLLIPAGLAAALAMAFRLDAALAAAALGLTLWVARRRFPLGFALAGALPLGAWLGWLYLRYGTVLPNTLAAKRGELGRSLHGYTAYEWLWLARTLSAGGALALLALAVTGAAVAWRRGLFARPFFRVLALWLALHEIAYRLLGVPFAPWYEEALLQALVFLAALAAVAGGGWASRWPPRQMMRREAVQVPASGWRRAAGTALALLLLAPVAAPSLAWTARQWGRPPDPRFVVYARAGRYLAAQAAAQAAAPAAVLQRSPSPADGATVAAVEIGILGYTSDLRVLDLAGLVSPQVLAARAGRLPELVVAARPDFIVDVPAFRRPILGAILARPEIAASYGAVAAFTAPDYGGGVVRIYRRER